MTFPLSGFGFLIAYVVLVGTASFLEKFSMKQERDWKPVVAKVLPSPGDGRAGDGRGAGGEGPSSLSLRSRL